MTSERRSQRGEEEKKVDAGTSLEELSKNIMSSTPPSTSTDIVLESMEDCVGCIDGIKEQQTFEENLLKQALHQREIAMEHGLSEAEAALIRLQIDNATAANGIASSAANGIRSAMENNILYPKLDDILEQVCGVQDITSACLTSIVSDNCNGRMLKQSVAGGGDGIPSDSTDDDPLSADLCKGMILPIDTTMPTTLPGNTLVDSRQRKIERSLLDVAAEDDALQDILEEENVSIDAEAIYECAICSDSVGTCDANGHHGSLRASTTSIVASKDLSSSIRKPVFCRLPCCEMKQLYDPDDPQARKLSNFNVCTACILVLTVATKDGISRVGRCPRCRQWISISTLHSTSAPMEVRTLQNTGKCEGCQKTASPLIIDDPPTCDGCFLSREASLGYECEECNEQQTINATLYRSQPSAKSFSTETHTCNHCEKPTHWRLQQDQLCFIPGNDIPEEWGDDFLELARLRVQIARQGIAKLNLIGKNPKEQLEGNGGCTVM